jgi:hypothetical protein
MAVATETESNWRKSSRCVAESNCVELANIAPNAFAVRDTKNGRGGPILTFGNSAFSTFIAEIKQGVLDLH